MIFIIRETKNKVYTKVNGKLIEFSKDKYEEFAILLAEESFKRQKRIFNLIEKIDDIYFMKIHSKTHGDFLIFIDEEDIDKIEKYQWHISKKCNSYYVYNNEVGPLHRYLLNENNPNIIIDHKNRNPLDNRKQNLRRTDKSGNGKNISMKSNNTSGYMGIRYDKLRNRWCVEIRDNNKNRIRKNFSCKKYGYDEAFKMAYDFRKQKEKEYGYFYDEECSETIETDECDFDFEE